MKNLMSATGLVVVLVLFLGFNLFTGAALTSARLDMTENRLYTLSQGTKNVLDALEEPITLKFYFSKGLAQQAPGIVSYAQRVEELLGEYEAESRGKLALEVKDPEPFSDTEDEAVASGLKGVPATSAGDMLYFGLVGTNSTDGTEVVEFFQDSREEFLEYDLTRLVHNLAKPKKKVVGILTALPLDGDPMARFTNPRAPNDPWFILEYLRQSFDVRMLPAGSETFDADLDVLVVVHPQNLSKRTQWAVDQHVRKGGKALVFVDPMFEEQQVPEDPSNPMAGMMADRASDLADLLGAWGLEMNKDEVAADKDLALKVQWQTGPIEYVVWWSARGDKDTLSKDDLTTAEIDQLNFATTGVLKKKDGATTTIAPLVTTTKSSMRVPKSKLQFGPNPPELLESFQSEDAAQVVAARVSGPAKSAFPDGRPAKDDGSEEPPAESVADSAGINVVVVADVDVLTDRLWVRVQNFFGQKVAVPQADNATFVSNTVDNLAGSTDLISLRSRGRSIRPFDVVADMRKEAEAKFRVRQKELEAKLKDAEAKIAELQANKDASSALILSPEQEAEIARFRDERVKTRKELRNVKRELEKDIKGLKASLVLVNAALVPLLVAIAGVLAWRLRQKKMMEARSSARRG